MPNINPNPSDQINISGNTFTVGATLPGTLTTGTFSSNITGLEPGISYYFAVVAYNNLSGYSGWAGPVVVYIVPEYRTYTYAFAWNWPSLSIGAQEIGRSYVSGSTTNLFVDSAGLTGIQTNLGYNAPFQYPAGTTFLSNISDPFGGNSAFGIITPGGGGAYSAVKHLTYNLTPGATYTFSFWHDVSPTNGSTIGNVRLVDFSPDYQNDSGVPSSQELKLKQIAPVVAGGYSEEPTVLYDYSNPSFTGWQRFAFTFTLGATLDKAAFYPITKNNPPATTSGYTHYFYGFQLEQGNTTTSYKPTTKNDALPGVFYRRFYYSDTGVGGGKNLKYTLADENALNFASQNGLTYLSFLEFTPNALFRPGEYIYTQSFASGITKSYNTYAGIERLKQLPVIKRVLQPNALANTQFWSKFDEERLLGATGNSLTFIDNDVAKNYPLLTSPSSNALYNPWPNVGATIAKNLWTSTLQTFKDKGLNEIAGVFMDMEGDPFGADPGADWPSKAANVLPYKTQYSQTGINGLSSWQNIFESAGGSLGRGVTAYVYTPYPDWLAWNRASKFYAAEYMNEIFYKPLQSIFGETVYLSNYEYFDKEAGLTAAAPDPVGHPLPSKRVGNATSPVCYGWVAQLGGLYSRTDNTVETIWVLDPNDSTTLIPVSYYPTGISLSRGPWTSFIQGMQQIREARRMNSNSYLTPWIGSVDYADENYTNLRGVCWSGPNQSPQEVRDQLTALGLSGNTASFWDNNPPYIGWANVNTGYNPRQGIYYTESGGNSAYYYEFIRHTMLHGTKSIGYFNIHDFIDVSVPGNTIAGQQYGIYNSTKGAYNYMLSGKTQHVQNMKLLNDVINEVQDKTKGFTLTTADSSRISWIAPYLASGAPGPNGITWYWRITTNPKYSTYVNGELLSVNNNNNVGTWVTTSGPTLSGITIISTLL